MSHNRAQIVVWCYKKRSRVVSNQTAIVVMLRQYQTFFVKRRLREEESAKLTLIYLGPHLLIVPTHHKSRFGVELLSIAAAISVIDTVRTINNHGEFWC